MSSRHASPSALRRCALLGALSCVTFAVVGTGGDARAQIAGTTQKPLPNVLLLVDSSGSMERMTDNSLPSANVANKCSPGSPSNPNRWGMLIQAMTGNLQPYFSCDAVDRTTASFKNEYRIGSGATAPTAKQLPYDADYFLPHHRPLTGNTAVDACAFAPNTLPGASPGNGLGPGGLGVNTGTYGDSSSFPPEAFKPYKEQYLRAQYGSSATGAPLDTSPTSANLCTFDQATDGQLDSARDYVRFGLMMFDNDPDAGFGVASNPQTSPTNTGGAVNTADPFTGQWTYTKSPSNPDPLLALGRPNGCGKTSDFDVGARHWAAPPWEGRMIRFPSPSGTLFDIETTNDQIQKVLLGTRPYGATPIDGMMEDARDYYWWSDYGPNGTKAGYKDDYSSCRDQYIILLTDGAPNLDLRPSCEPDSNLPISLCPYKNKASAVADALAQATDKAHHVQTYVIGFSVNGAGNGSFVNDGFPAPTFNAPKNNCKDFYSQPAGGNGNPATMHGICTGPTAPPAGSTADACCKLSEIAYFGSPAHDVPPFFAETQADLVLSFGRVLGGITKAATTRTLPGYSPAATISGQSVTGDFIASFIPNAQRVWSGEIDRTRSICVGPAPMAQPENTTAGDSMAFNLANQAAVGKRLFISVSATPGSAIAPAPAGVAVDSMRSIRPFDTTTADGIGFNGGSQIVGFDDTIASNPAANWKQALLIDNSTCKRSRDILGNTIPALSGDDCTKVIWDFATASKSTMPYGGYSSWNKRCTGGATTGHCSFNTGTSCTLLGPACPTAGEVCVPDCSALGAIYRSSPVLVGPPTDLLRDDSYRTFSDLHKYRRPAMFTATTDGVLHAFKALSSGWGGGVPAFDDNPTGHELWAFVPPAVLPKLSTNYPGGQQILLDGTPAVKDIVWDRNRVAEAPFFHTTLVSGMGAGGGGYYALNVSDVGCQDPGDIGVISSKSCTDATVATVSTLTNVADPAVKGPQFLWQLTDVESNGATDPAKPSRTSLDGKKFVALLGGQSGNAAIATLLVNPDHTTARQVGVAILPGGIDGPPVPGGFCPRALYGGAQGAFPTGTFDQSDTALAPRLLVRQWAVGGCDTAPVPGRNVTIVRADTGEVIRVFGRRNQDIPQKLVNAGVFTPAPFDSPVIGTPAIYPNDVGVTTQKIFVGDADGTLWRIDVSSTDPALWSVSLFQDVVSKDIVASPTPSWAQSQPIQIQPTISLDPFGGLMVAVATGDQENIVASSTENNYLMSISEQRAVSATQPGRAVVRWFQSFTGAARVTGPMTVFDRALYFASYQPQIPTAANCSKGGSALLWGMDYYNAKDGNDAVTGRALVQGTGGAPRWCPIGRVDPASGACKDPFIPNEDPANPPTTNGYTSLVGAIIPGVTIRAQQSCAQVGGPPGDPAITGLSATTFSLFFGATASGTSSTGSPQAARPSTPLTRPLPRTAANIDSWALVVD